MKKLLATFIFLMATLSVMAQDQVIINSSVHLHGSANYVIAGHAGCEITKSNTKQYMKGAQWHLETIYTNSEHTVRFWIELGGEKSDVKEWSGNSTKVYKKDHLDNDGVTRVRYIIMSDGVQGLTIAKMKGGEYAIWDPQTEDNKPKEQFVNMNRDFNVGGHCICFSKQKQVLPDDVCDLKWELKNTVIGQDNHITLSIYNMDGSLCDYRSWVKSTNVTMMIDEKGLKNYYVSDDMFSHLMIIEQGNEDYIIRLFTEMLQK